MGLVKGKGTSTSDSIPAKLSKGEVVIPAAVAKHYGPAYFTKLIASVPKEKGAKTEFKGGVLKAAGGYNFGDDPKLFEALQRAKVTANAPKTNGFGGANPKPGLINVAGTSAERDAFINRPVADEVIELKPTSPQRNAQVNRPLPGESKPYRPMSAEAADFTRATQGEIPGATPKPAGVVTASSPDAWANEGASVSGNAVRSAIGKGISKGLGAMGAAGSVVGLADLARQPSELDNQLALRAKNGDAQAAQIMATGGVNPWMTAIKKPINAALAPVEAGITYAGEQFDKHIGYPAVRGLDNLINGQEAVAATAPANQPTTSLAPKAAAGTAEKPVAPAVTNAIPVTRPAGVDTPVAADTGTVAPTAPASGAAPPPVSATQTMQPFRQRGGREGPQVSTLNFTDGLGGTGMIQSEGGWKLSDAQMDSLKSSLAHEAKPEVIARRKEAARLMNEETAKSLSDRRRAEFENIALYSRNKNRRAAALGVLKSLDEQAQNRQQGQQEELKIGLGQKNLEATATANALEKKRLQTRDDATDRRGEETLQLARDNAANTPRERSLPDGTKVKVTDAEWPGTLNQFELDAFDSNKDNQPSLFGRNAEEISAERAKVGLRPTGAKNGSPTGVHPDVAKALRDMNSGDKDKARAGAGYLQKYYPDDYNQYLQQGK